MINAKDELAEKLIEHGSPAIAWASISFEDDGRTWVFELFPHHLISEQKEFFQLLDFRYDNGYGGQKLYGTVALENGCWLERCEYDGSEWWEHRQYPMFQTGKH